MEPGAGWSQTSDRQHRHRAQRSHQGFCRKPAGRLRRPPGAAVSASEKLTLFDLSTVSAIRSAKIEAGYPALLSPGGKFFLIRTRDTAYKYREPTVISAETGKPIGMLDPGAVADDPPLSFHSVAAFTPLGKHIAFRWDQPGQKVQLHPGETIEAAIKRVSSPDYEFFDRAEIPEHVARQHEPIYYGTSTLQPAD